MLEVFCQFLKYYFLNYKIVLNYKTIYIFGKTKIRNSTEEYKMKSEMFYSQTISRPITRGNFLNHFCFYLFLRWLVLYFK